MFIGELSFNGKNIEDKDLTTVIYLQVLKINERMLNDLT